MGDANNNIIILYLKNNKQLKKIIMDGNYLKREDYKDEFEDEIKRVELPIDIKANSKKVKSALDFLIQFNKTL